MKLLLKQDTKKSILNVGFDAQILYYNKKEKICRFAGARNPLYYIKSFEIYEIKADRHSIGYKNSDINYIFSEHEFVVEDGVIIYLATDGYWDQLGGKQRLPYGRKRFKKLLLDNHKETLSDQQEILLYEIDEYQDIGDINRIDDITIIGLAV